MVSPLPSRPLVELAVVPGCSRWVKGEMQLVVGVGTRGSSERTHKVDPEHQSGFLTGSSLAAVRAQLLHGSRRYSARRCGAAEEGQPAR
jgi:hypothetical protein